MRIELTASAWEAEVLPLYDARVESYALYAGFLQTGSHAGRNLTVDR